MRVYCGAFRLICIGAVFCLLRESNSLAASANRFELENLVSDLPGLADFTDPNLVNPWGLASSPTSPFWIANNGTGTSTLYNGAGQPQPQPTPLVVSVPTAPPQPASLPTGLVFNNSADFELVPGSRAFFLFSTETGQIAGWNPNVNQSHAIVPFLATDGAAYKGLTMANNGGQNLLYAPDFENAKIDVINGAFQKTTLSGSFVDPNLPAGFAPFNIENFGGKLYVTYAKSDGNDDIPGLGNGLVSIFDLNGNFEKRLITGGELNSPWGLAIAPADFGPFAGDLLVGNFGDGRINVYDLLSGDFVDTLKHLNGASLVIDGLWALRFGNGAAGGELDELYFTAGIQGEAHGLFGEITPAAANTVPEGGTTLALLFTSALALFGTRKTRTVQRGI
jgi:uncharacterized protein (TIGR03118 family)